MCVSGVCVCASVCVNGGVSVWVDVSGCVSEWVCGERDVCVSACVSEKM